MKHRKLSLDELQVDSFQTTPEIPGEGGTVLGHAAIGAEEAALLTEGTTCQGATCEGKTCEYQTCAGPSCQNTFCYRTCGDTCNLTCPADLTCGFTCGISCNGGTCPSGGPICCAIATEPVDAY